MSDRQRKNQLVLGFLAEVEAQRAAREGTESLTANGSTVVSQGKRATAYLSEFVSGAFPGHGVGWGGSCGGIGAPAARPV